MPAVPPARVTLVSVLVPVGLAVIGLLAFGPLWRGALMTTVLALSFVVLTGFGGQTSLAQLAFAGVAGFTFSKLATNWGIPFPIAPVLAALVQSGYDGLVGVDKSKLTDYVSTLSRLLLNSLDRALQVALDLD